MKEAEDLMSLIEQHRNETWEWKQRESQWIRDKNQLDGNKRIIEELSAKIVEMGKANSPGMKPLQAKVNELEGTLASAQDINKNHQRYNGKLQSRLTEVEEDNRRLSKQIQDLNNRKS